jgi:hypothetical protein
MNSSRTAPLYEEEIVDKLVATLPETLKDFSPGKVRRQTRGPGGSRWDLTLDLLKGSSKKKLIFEVKTIGEPRFALMSMSRLELARKTVPNSYPVFAASYIAERTRSMLKERNIGYVDLTGNIFLRFGDLWIERASTESARRERRGLKSLTSKKATRVLRVLLQDPRRRSTITALAKDCSMSPAAVFWTVKLLEERGYVERGKKKEVILTRPGELLDDWSKGWDIRRNSWTPYFSFEKKPETLMKMIASFAAEKGLEYAFTLAAGASLVAPFVRFNEVWMYIKGPDEPWIRGLDLRPVEEGGNIMLMTPYDESVFWNVRFAGGMKVVDDIQLYVDLYNTGGRGREQAEFIRQQKMAALRKSI